MPKANRQTSHLKKEMLKALESCLGVVTSAAKRVGIDRNTHYLWMRNDEKYNEAVLSLQDVALDFAESSLMNQIKAGDTTATIFYLKTKGKRRGYIEKIEIDKKDIPATKSDLIAELASIAELEGLSLEEICEREGIEIEIE